VVWKVGPNEGAARTAHNSKIIKALIISIYVHMDGPGSNPGGDEIFRPSRPVLGPTQPPVKWVRVFPGSKVRPGRAADHSPPSSAAVMEE